MVLIFAQLGDHSLLLYQLKLEFMLDAFYDVVPFVLHVGDCIKQFLLLSYKSCAFLP